MDKLSDKSGEFAKLIRALTDKEYVALKESIAENGVLVPIELDELGGILDGRHRLRICEELGIKNYPTIIRQGLTDEEKRAHILTLNYDRRHLTKEECNERIAQLHVEGRSTRQIAEKVGMNHSTIVRKLGSTGANAPVDRVIGKDGKSRPAHHSAIFASTRQEEKKALEAATSGAKLPSKVITANRAARLAREYKAELRAEEAKGDICIGKATLLLGTLWGENGRDDDIPEESVDLIFTDPPYEKQATSGYEELAILATKVLKVGGFLVTYCGCLYLDTVFESFRGDVDNASDPRNALKYIWTIALTMPGKHSRVHVVSVTQGWKPLLVFQKTCSNIISNWQNEEEHKTSLRWMEDTFASEGVQKSEHDWQQSIGCAKYYIGKLLPKGGTVLDPFLGSGTTGVAALECGCDFIGIERDKKAFAAAQKRLQSVK